MECPKEIVQDVDRKLLLLSEYCTYADEINVFQSVLDSFGELKKIVENKLIGKCK